MMKGRPFELSSGALLVRVSKMTEVVVEASLSSTLCTYGTRLFAQERKRIDDVQNQSVG